MSSEDNVVNGVSSSVSPVDYSAGLFIYERLLENIQERIAFLNEVTQEQITYGNFLQYSCRLAESLIKYGITSENIVSIYCENCIEYFIPIMACLFAGVPICPTNSMYVEHELTHAFNLIRPPIVFCSIKNVSKMLELKEKHSEIKEIIVINSDTSIPGARNLKKFIDKYSACLDIYTYKPAAVDVENQVAFIMFSSGTTGLPKGVMITHKNLNFKNAMVLESDLNVKTDTLSQYVLGFLPFFHAFGLHVAINDITLGRTVVVLEKFDFEFHLKLIDKYKITTLAVVPPILQMYAKHSLMDQYDLSHVEHVLVAGASVNEALPRIVTERTGIKNIGQGFGMSETTFVVAMTPVYVDRPASCGRLTPNVTAVVKDLKTRHNLGSYQIGELCFKGGMIMKGYYKNETATQNSFTEDGYLRSGDIGYYDEQGYFYIVERDKDIIRYKCHQVSPAELEGVLLTNKKIKTAAVIGIPDEDAGELPMAFVVKQPNVDLTEKEVMDYVKEFLAPVKYLRGGVVFVDGIPINPAGKIMRTMLRN